RRAADPPPLPYTPLSRPPAPAPPRWLPAPLSPRARPSPAPAKSFAASGRTYRTKRRERRGVPPPTGTPPLIARRPAGATSCVDRPNPRAAARPPHAPASPHRERAPPGTSGCQPAHRERSGPGPYAEPLAPRHTAPCPIPLIPPPSGPQKPNILSSLFRGGLVENAHGVGLLTTPRRSTQEKCRKRGGFPAIPYLCPLTAARGRG